MNQEYWEKLHNFGELNPPAVVVEAIANAPLIPNETCLTSRIWSRTWIFYCLCYLIRLEIQTFAIYFYEYACRMYHADGLAKGTYCTVVDMVRERPLLMSDIMVGKRSKIAPKMDMLGRSKMTKKCGKS